MFEDVFNSFIFFIWNPNEDLVLQEVLTTSCVLSGSVSCVHLETWVSMPTPYMLFNVYCCDVVGILLGINDASEQNCYSRT